MTTLYINLSDSSCGSCNRNADPYELAHDMKTMIGEGCGVTYTAVSSHYNDPDGRLKARIEAMRPDLPYRGIGGAA